MTTFTTQGFSRTLDWETSTYSDFRGASLEVIRQDGQADFMYHYNWIDETGSGPFFAQIFDPWSLSAILTLTGVAGEIDLKNDTAFIERQVYAIDLGAGKTTYVLGFFQPVEGIETCFFIGGDAPPALTDLASLNAFLANPMRQILEGAFEGGNQIPLSGFLNGSATEDDVVTALDGKALYWNAGVGNDTVTGGATDDTLLGGAGNDVMATGGGSDSLVGLAGDDVLTGSGTHSFLSGGQGNDTISGDSEFGDQMDGGAGNDLITLGDGRLMGDVRVSHSHALGGSGDDTITGGLAGDMAQGGAGNDQITGGDGQDGLDGNAGDDTLNGGAQNDSLGGHAGKDSILGDIGDDLIDGGTGADVLRGDNGRDSIQGGDGNDNALGGNHDDVIMGGLGQDKLNGNAGNDSLYGDDGNDLLTGEGGNDALSGGTGADTLVGGLGIDTLLGEAGADVFRFLDAPDSPTATPDTISDFLSGTDVIDLGKIDAMAGSAGNQAFTFIGSAAFTAEGQVRAVVIGPHVMLELNTTGTGGAEMMIVVGGGSGVVAGDLLL